jgi:transposase
VHTRRVKGLGRAQAANPRSWVRRFLEDGRIELDNNSVERAMRPVALSRKNSLFAGSDEGGENWACLASLIETCKLNGVNPQTYFTDLLTRLVNGWPQKRIEELMPWHWIPRKRCRLPTAIMARDVPVPVMSC